MAKIGLFRVPDIVASDFGLSSLSTLHVGQLSLVAIMILLQ